MPVLNLPAVTEDLSRVQGVIAGCGQAALLVILHVTKGLPLTPGEVTALITQGINGNQAGVGGTSTPANLEWLAAQYGTQLQTVPTDTGTLSKYAGQAPIILGVNNAAAFGGNDVGVHGHYVTVIGVQGDSFIVDDPNTIASQSGESVTYTAQQIEAAQPFWAAITPLSPAMLQGTQLASTTGSSNPLDAIGTFFSSLGGLLAWLGNPIRILKLLVGLGLIAAALFIAFVRTDTGKTVINLGKLAAA